jgi:succinate dehydrogenase/fumarate reductase flavoprotein subunit
MEFIQYEPTVALSPERLVGKSIITTMLFEGAVIRNAKGERFMDEKVGKDALSEGISRELLRGGGTKNGGVFYDMSAVPEDMLLGKYKDYYQRYAAASIDIRKTPVEISPAPHTTMGGALINPRCESEIRGLFVAGEAAGGLHGANRLGGNAGLEVLVFGDIAGGAICDFLAQKLDTGAHLCDDEGEIPDAPFDSSDLKERLYEICDKALGVVKNERDLSWALKECRELVRVASEHPSSYSAKRLYNDALTAEAVIIAALERRSSVGAHIREDGISESEKYRLVLRKNNGTIKPERQAIK